MIFDTFPLRQAQVQRQACQARQAQTYVQKCVCLLSVMFILTGNIAFGQLMPPGEVLMPGGAELKYRGQFSTWGGYSSGFEWPVMLGARYLPQLNLEVPLSVKSDLGAVRFDAEVSGNIYGSGLIKPFSDGVWDGKIKLYRGWGRVSSDKAELRVGLQKINFGSAMMLRPLMWFDSMDPRDPLQMTDGVWSALGRYYFNNNANLWVWGLLGNSRRKALDLLPSDGGIPEFGGRLQLPVGKGEVAFTFHRRKTDVTEAGIEGLINGFYENRYGIDMRFDYEVGFWFEAVWINRRNSGNVGIDQRINQRMVTVGADYTFGLGNGLGVAVEHMWAERANVSALNVNYPVNMENSLSWMCYSVWGGGGVYNLLRWKRMLSFGDLYVTAFVNPDSSGLNGSAFSGSPLPGMEGGVNPLSGKGIQIMLVINHQTK